MKTQELMTEDYRSLGPMAKAKWLWLYWTWRLVTWLGKKLGRPYWWNGGRRDDGDPTVCPECKHVLRVRDCVHTYSGWGGEDEVEGVEECPKCGSEL